MLLIIVCYAFWRNGYRRNIDMNSNHLMTALYLLGRAGRLLARRGDRRFGDMGLAFAQVPVLGSLRNGEALSQAELAKLVQIEQPTMAALLGRMERDGLIERAPDPHDKRVSQVSLSAAARGRMPQVRAALVAGSKEALAGFDAGDIATLTALLERVVANLEQAAQK